MVEHALVQAGEKVVKVQSAFVRVGQGLEEAVQQPAFTATDRPMQIQAAGLSVIDQGRLGREVFNHLQLSVTQGVSLCRSLLAKMLTNGPGNPGGVV